MKWYTRWKHRRMIRKAYSFWYMEQGSIARKMWKWRRENPGVRFASATEALSRFGQEYAKHMSGEFR